MRTAVEEIRLKKLQNYLEKLLGSKRKTRELLQAIKENRPILIDGPQGPTGKTTLCQALRDAGVIAYEKWTMHEVILENEVDRTTNPF